jgi:hypothetical protein
MASLLRGSQVWEPVVGGVTDFYIHYVDNKKETSLPYNASLNCYELIIYSGFLAGRISAQQIRDFYKFPFPGIPNETIIWERLGWSKDLPEYSIKVPRVSDLVFFTPIESRILTKVLRDNPGHVGISVGGELIVNSLSTSGKRRTERVRLDKISSVYNLPALKGLIQVGLPITLTEFFDKN